MDGGIGVLASYASQGRRELPDDAVLLDGDAAQLGKGGQFLGQHILTPRRGVAVQINAFNFPVWGPLEKFAPAFLAGVPSLVKPASSTAYLTARLVELIASSGLLPDGSLQLICGSAGDLLDHLTDQDSVSFTGSASTAQRLRAHPTVVARSVRFNAEADSLNCSILGPDAGPGSPEFDLYVAQLVTEMTVKAGQKCTAIRRALVPEPLLDAVAEAASARLAKVVVGNPADERVRMGALASLDQRDEVRRSLKALLSAGTAVFGDPEHVEVVGADPDRGAFMSPVLIRAEDAGRAEPHEVEAFGPVSTLIGYRDTAHASSWPPAAWAAWPDLSSPGTPGSPVTSCSASRPGTAVCSSSTPTTRPSPPGTALRCQCWCTAARAGPAAARSWAACGPSPTTCSAPRSRPARGCWPGSPAGGCRAASAARTARTRSGNRSRSCASATRSSPGRGR